MVEIHAQKKPNLENKTSQNIQTVVICGECESGFMDTQTCHDHIDAKHRTTPPIEPVTCDKCNLVVANSILMQEHTHKYHEDSKMIPCGNCEVVLEDATSLERHMEEAHESKTFGCKQCSFESDLYIEILRHTFQYHDVCKGTNKAFSPTDIILEFLAEAFEQLYNGLKVAFEQLSNGIQDNFNMLAAKTSTKSVLPDQTPPAQPTQVPQVPSPPKTATQPPSGTSTSRRKVKTSFLSKPRILYVGDSVAQNVAAKQIENVTKSRIIYKKAYSSTFDIRARWPKSNVKDVIKHAISEAPADDKFEYVRLSAPTMDITNLYTYKVQPSDNIDSLKTEVRKSCRKMIDIAEDIIKGENDTKKVLILEHPPRFVSGSKDPLSLKSELSRYANTLYQQMWFYSDVKHKLVLGKHNLDSSQQTRLDIFYEQRK